MTPLDAVLRVLLLLFFLSCAADADNGDNKCPSRWCGRHNISHPFRLQDSPVYCGDPSYTLSCEDEQLLLYWNSGKFSVQSINYNNYTIRLVDANIDGHSSSSFPPYSLSLYNISYLLPTYEYLFRRASSRSDQRLVKQVLYLSCPHPHALGSCDLYVNGTSAATSMNVWNASGSGSTFYVNSIEESLWDLGLEDSCRIQWMYITSWPALHNHTNTITNISCTDIHNMLLYGFELSWSIPSTGYILELTKMIATSAGYVIALFILARFLLGIPLVILLCVYKWRRRHLSMFGTIEDFLRGENNIIPIRYSYRDIKRITGGFNTKLGNGGYGSVFQGKLRSGRLVAIKVLNNAKSNGQDFINEVATIGRIHHVNVVQLIGFCVEGSKRALIYELMENGSLEKYIFSNEESASLSCEKLHTISLGVARGIEYLHNGCDMKILHFDIKPHNILLDDNFNPKVSDFGLARLYPTDKSVVSLTAVRGTIGYMAPELFYRNVGSISYKADVYSFGMLLMEMAGRRKNLNALTEHSSHIYFPFWVYDQLHEGKEIAIEDDTDEEMKLAKKMMIVALWCIQPKPGDRPSMDKVVEMLEQADEGSLEMPPKPYFCDPHEVSAGDESSSSHVSVSDSKESI